MKASIKELRERNARLESLKLHKLLPSNEKFCTSKKPKIKRTISKHVRGRKGYRPPIILAPELEPVVTEKNLGDPDEPIKLAE
jgi:hypothetical protein